MVNRAKCPVCKSYCSGVYRALHYDYSPCPYCQTSHELLTKWAKMSDKLEKLHAKRISEDLILEVQQVNEQNFILLNKLNRLQKVLGYDDTIVKPILDAIKILNNEEVVDERE